MARKFFNFGHISSEKSNVNDKWSENNATKEKAKTDTDFRGVSAKLSPNVSYIESSIKKSPLVITDSASTRLSYKSASIFSKGKTTLSSSQISSNVSSAEFESRAAKKSGTINESAAELGKRLRIINTRKSFDLGMVTEEEQSQKQLQYSDYSSNKPARKDCVSLPELHRNNAHSCEQQLYILENNLVELVDDLHQNVVNISKAVIQSVEYFKDFLILGNKQNSVLSINIESNPRFRRISKIVFHFMDNLLISEGYSNSRYILLKRYLQFLQRLNIDPLEENHLTPQTLPILKNFCIDDKISSHNGKKVKIIMEELLNSESTVISDQEGSFIAPIRRGLCERASILSIVFGVPNIHQEHQEMMKVLYYLFPDIHLYLIRDQIISCAKVESSIPRNVQNLNLSSFFSSISKEPESTKFSPPYKIAEFPLSPPISMSISAENSTKISGTLGGYIFPQIETNSKFSQFAGSSFAITSAHVVLSESQDYPHVTVPSKILQMSYMNTLKSEAEKYPGESKERLAFLNEVNHVTNNIKWQEKNPFGQVVWGERSIVNQRLSDFAIIKVNPDYNCENCLGNTADFSKDPTLKFQNTYVKTKFIKINSGLKVFKIGASSGYTSGQVNGTRLVYWADGKLQTSEFVVASPLPLFATAGDSGSWILAKSEDYLGLGVVGMLHAYDGSQQQFGLFTPIVDILERLHDVTGVQWDIDP